MKRVLVVDDDRSTTEALALLLVSDSFDVVTLSSSTTAAERLRRERFDAVITDLEMPEVHGIELVRLARTTWPDMPVLLVTAYAGSPACQKALALGARLIRKPVEYGVLLMTLRAALEPCGS